MEIEQSCIIEHSRIESLLRMETPSPETVDGILSRSEQGIQPNIYEIAQLLSVDDASVWNRIFELSSIIKKKIYGNRIVIFAPLYISNYCVNDCLYCGYNCKNGIPRRKLTMSEIEQEVKILESMGHKRLALELGEDPENTPIEYVLQAIQTIYNTKLAKGAIRRINVNIAATDVREYKMLKEAEIGTYILFQETYHRENYKKWHGSSKKSDYDYHIHAFSRAMQAGIDDVGAGVLFGLSPWKYEVLGLMMHNQFLEDHFGVGFHTISVPRIKSASGLNMSSIPNAIDDYTFKKIVSILRLAVPYTGIILSTRESANLRKEVIRLGVSQISAGSSTGVGGYKSDEEARNTEQFTVEDHRPNLEIVKDLIHQGYIPSYCTACYRNGRTGDRFMELAKSGKIQQVCHPNALLTLMEYAISYGDAELRDMVESLIFDEVQNIPGSKMKEHVIEALKKIKQGKTDFFV